MTIHNLLPSLIIENGERSAVISSMFANIMTNQQEWSFLVLNIHDPGSPLRLFGYLKTTMVNHVYISVNSGKYWLRLFNTGKFTVKDITI